MLSGVFLIRTYAINKDSTEEQDLVNQCREKGKVKMLSRDAVRQKLVSWGIAEPTDDQINDYLAQISKEIKGSEEKAEHFRNEANRVKDLEKELKALNEANLSDSEKSQKAVEEANAEIAKLRATVKAMELSKALAEIGIIGEDADGLFDNGELNTAKLGEIITSREKNAVAAYQKEALNATPSPQGSGKEEPEDKPDVAYAKEYVAKAKGNDTQSIIDSYK